jgi:hypothetical protein
MRLILKGTPQLCGRSLFLREWGGPAGVVGQYSYYHSPACAAEPLRQSAKGLGGLASSRVAS